MDWKKLAWCAVLSGASMGLVACGGDDDGGGPTPEAQTVAYVLSTAAIPQPDGSMSVGFNLDDLVSPGDMEAESCVEQAEDYTSAVNGAGVDNGFSGIASLLEGMIEGGIAGALEAQIAEGGFLLIMEVSDVNSFATDSSVNVHLFLGTVEGGTVMVGDGGRIAAGQSFTVMQEIATVAGSIEGGRVIVDDVNLPLRLNVMDMDLNLTLRAASLSAQISPTGLGAGEIGAYLLLSDIVMVAQQFGLGDMINEEFIANIAPPDINAEGDTSECEALSLGLTFEAVGAETAATAE